MDNVFIGLVVPLPNSPVPLYPHTYNDPSVINIVVKFSPTLTALAVFPVVFVSAVNSNRFVVVPSPV